MRLGEPLFGIADGIGHRRPLLHAPRIFQRGPQQGPGFGVIGDGQAGQRAGHILPIGFDQGGIDAIQRGSAHQSNDFRYFRHLCYLPVY